MVSTRLQSMGVVGIISSTTQGTCTGSSMDLPEPDERTLGVVRQYLGDDVTGYQWFLGDGFNGPGVLVHDHFYRCSASPPGSAIPYCWKDVTPYYAQMVSDNNFTDAYKDKLNTIEADAEVNIIETIYVNQVVQETRKDSQGRNTKHLYLTLMEGVVISAGTMVPGEPKAIETGLDADGSRFAGCKIYSAQIRDPSGNVLDCAMTITTPLVTATYHGPSNVNGCELFLVVGP